MSDISTFIVQVELTGDYGLALRALHKTGMYGNSLGQTVHNVLTSGLKPRAIYLELFRYGTFNKDSFDEVNTQIGDQFRDGDFTRTLGTLETRYDDAKVECVIEYLREQHKLERKEK